MGTLTDRLATLRVAGIFSTSGNKVNSRGTSRHQAGRIYHGARTVAAGVLEICTLVDDMPYSGPMLEARRMEAQRFLAVAMPEPAYLLHRTLPRLDDRPEVQGYPRTREDVVRGACGQALLFLAHGRADAALALYDFLLAEGCAIEGQKRIINALAMELRKDGEPAKALACFETLRDIFGTDENLHCNMARCCLETGDRAACSVHVAEALRINPYCVPAIRFAEYLRTQRFRQG